MNKIKILHIIKSLGRGGAEMLLPETLRLHDQQQFEFHYVYFLPWKNQMVSALQQNGGKVVCFAAGNNISLLLKASAVAKYVRENNIELIHAHLPWAGVLARIVGRMTGIKVIYTEHNKQERYHFATRLINLATMNWLTKVIAVSEDVQVSITQHKKHLTSPVQAILNGVNTDHFNPANLSENNIREQLSIPHGALIIGTIAVFRFQKRLDLWLEIAKQIAAKVPGTHFVIVGDGPLHSTLREKCASLNLDGIVHFAGLQTDVRPYLSMMDIYMMTSIFEGLPVALLEAMASGCPVISTNAGGIKEVIRHGQDGLLCDVNNAAVLADYASELLTDAQKRNLLGKAARKRIESNFSMAAMVSELEAVYKQSCER